MTDLKTLDDIKRELEYWTEIVNNLSVVSENTLIYIRKLRKVVKELDPDYEFKECNRPI